MSERYYRWIADCCQELGWDIREGERMVEDVNWWGCYDDGMTPKEAVDEAVSKGVVKRGESSK